MVFKKMWQWFTNLIYPKEVKEEVKVLKSTYTATTPVPEVSEIRRAKAKREQRRMRNLNDKTKGAFGQPKVTPHYASMKRDRGD